MQQRLLNCVRGRIPPLVPQVYSLSAAKSPCLVIVYSAHMRLLCVREQHIFSWFLVLVPDMKSICRVVHRPAVLKEVKPPREVLSLNAAIWSHLVAKHHNKKAKFLWNGFTGPTLAWFLRRGSCRKEEFMWVATTKVTNTTCSGLQLTVGAHWNQSPFQYIGSYLSESWVSIHPRNVQNLILQFCN